MFPGNEDYYRAREQRERELAERAESEEARAIHAALAERYAALAGGKPAKNSAHG